LNAKILNLCLSSPMNYEDSEVILPVCSLCKESIQTNVHFPTKSLQLNGLMIGHFQLEMGIANNESKVLKEVDIIVLFFEDLVTPNDPHISIYATHTRARKLLRVPTRKLRRCGNAGGLQL